MRGIIFVAPPAAGKGTQAKFVCEKYGYEHISTGDLLRKSASEETLEALYIKEKMNSGELVDDSLIIDLLKNRLDDIKSEGFILDGFPRNLYQAELLEQMLDNIKLYVFYIDVDFNVVMKRFTGRISCPTCGRVYNSLIDGLKPKQQNICDSCGSNLVVRSDDNEQTFTRRYEVYSNETEALINYYSDKKVLYHINGNLDEKSIFKQIVNVLEGENNG